MVNATNVTAVTGAATAIALALTSAGITFSGNEAVTLTETSLGAVTLVAIDGALLTWLPAAFDAG